jgi:hypothetical protein
MPELRVREYNHTIIIYIIKYLKSCSRFIEVEINCMDNFLRNTIRLAQYVRKANIKHIVLFLDTNIALFKSSKSSIHDIVSCARMLFFTTPFEW